MQFSIIFKVDSVANKVATSPNINQYRLYWTFICEKHNLMCVINACVQTLLKIRFNQLLNKKLPKKCRNLQNRQNGF